MNIPITEVVLFGTTVHADLAGFRRPGRGHDRWPHMMAWVVGDDPDRLRGRQFERVTVTDSARRHVYGDRRLERDLADVLDIARRQLRLGLMIWLEL